MVSLGERPLEVVGVVVVVVVVVVLLALFDVLVLLPVLAFLLHPALKARTVSASASAMVLGRLTNDL